MGDVRLVSAAEYNKLLAVALKEQCSSFEPPEWIIFAKTSTSKTRPNEDIDFWYKRAASILRQIYIRGIVGVSRLRTRYGSKKKRGGKPSEFRKGGGKIIRLILQQAEKEEILKKGTEGKAGRELTDKGRKFLESIAEGAE